LEAVIARCTKALPPAQYNTIKSFVTHAWSAGGLNMRHWACRRGKNGEAGLREGMGEIIRLEVPLKRGK